MTQKDPYLRMSNQQYRDLMPVYETDDSLGLFPKLIIGGISLLIGAGCAVMFVIDATYRELRG